MKRILLYLLPLCSLLAAVSCSKDAAEGRGCSEAVVLTVYADNGNGTRTSLDGVDILWSEKDVLDIWSAEGKRAVTTKTVVSADGRTARFTCPDGFVPTYVASPGGMGLIDGFSMSVSPYFSVFFRNVQEATANSFAPDANIALAAIPKDDPDHIYLRNVGGLVCFIIKESKHKIVSARIEGASASKNSSGKGIPMSGSITVKIDEEGEPYLTGGFNASNAYDYIEVKAKDGEYLKTGTKYYAVFPPATYSNVMITFTDSEGKTATYTKKAPLEVTRNSNQLIGSFSIAEEKWKGESHYYINGHEYIDMGNGVKWATMNVGASAPEKYGDYFAWGETKTKEKFDWETYKWIADGQTKYEYINKYTVDDGTSGAAWYDAKGKFIGDNKTVLDLEDDAARVNWGGSWRIPTEKEWTWLRENCIWTWQRQLEDASGTVVQEAGYVVKGKNGSIFLPATGYRYGSAKYDPVTTGNYWSSSLSDKTTNAIAISISSSRNDRVSNYRMYGFSVRPVSD